MLLTRWDRSRRSGCLYGRVPVRGEPVVDLGGVESDEVADLDVGDAPGGARRMVLADLVAQMDDLDYKLDPDGTFPIDDLPLIRFENMLTEAGLIREDEEAPIDPQEFEDAQLEQVIKFARRALSDGLKLLAEQTRRR
jgi:hypothetical protein